jgi:RNA polymerase sigma factor (sigma-70 family)
MMPDRRVEDLLRDLAPVVLGVLARRDADFTACEDAVQEALIAAAAQWPAEGVPDNPRGWLITVASRRLVDDRRSELARRLREEKVVALSPPEPEPDQAPSDVDDTLTLLFLCCHPALSPASQLALTLRAVGGLTTAEIARAFLVPETSMAQRISRAKQKVRTAGVPFQLPPPAEVPERLNVVLHVLYLMFTEGHTTTSGASLQRVDLTTEAIRLTRTVHRLLPDDGEVTGLLALMLLSDARRAARTGPDGALIPLLEQDRGLWDRVAIAEGVALITATLAVAPPGPFQLQAAIAAVHAETVRAEETDWRQILQLYGVLADLAPSPVISLNRSVAAAMVHGPQVGLDLLAELESGGGLRQSHRLDAVRGHLLELAGDHPGARTAYRAAARGSISQPERRYLESRAAALDNALPDG